MPHPHSDGDFQPFHHISAAGIYCHYTRTGNQAVTGTLTDLQGKIVLTQEFLKNNDIVNQHQLNVSDLPKGIYILTLTTPLQKQNLKITIQ